MSIQANKQNAISLQVAIEEYFRDNNLDEEIIDYDFGNDTTTEWYFFCKGDDFKYIDDNELHAYIEDLKDFRNEEFEVFSYRDEISIKILNDKFEESKKSARKSLKEEKEIWIIKSKDDLQYVGKKIFDVCEDIENARKFKSKFEAEEFLKKHDKALDYRYWKVINIDSESKESARKSLKESLNFKKDYAVEVMGGTYWLKPFYWDFDEFRDDLLIASEEYGFTYYITEATTTDYRINLEFNDGFDMRYDITFRIIPKSDKATAKELNDYLN